MAVKVNRNKTIAVRATGAEKTMYEERCRQSSMTSGEYARTVLLGDIDPLTAIKFYQENKLARQAEVEA